MNTRGSTSRHPNGWQATLLALVMGALLVAPRTAAAAAGDVPLDVHQFRVVERESGPTNYYSVVEDPERPFLRALYKPPLETVVLGVQLPDAARRAARGLHWSWRARVLPPDPGRCSGNSGIADTAAMVYVIWKRGLRWYSLRYVWTTSSQKGNVCGGKRNMFVAEDTVVLENGAGSGGWVSEEIDIQGEFRRHFESGNPNSDVPDLVGIGLMTDGDQTASVSSADYSDFVLRTASP